jgi:mono/diheme cytochrome c family protein
MKSIDAGVLLVALASLSMIGVAAAEAPAADGNPLNGKRVFLADGCYYCHGTTGAGGGSAGPRLAPGPLPLEGVRAKLRTSSGRMPVYSSKVLSDSDIADIVAYLQSIPRGPDAKDIPLLNH